MKHRTWGMYIIYSNLPDILKINYIRLGFSNYNVNQVIKIKMANMIVAIKIPRAEL